MIRSDGQVRNIDIQIDRLVLDGIDVPRRQRAALRAAVEAELALLITADGFATGVPRNGTTPRAQASSIKLTDAGDPAHIGRQIAQAVYGGIKR